ncbi:MAG TPA: glycoside hydrolase family 32 protein [Spirochaetales bacterium]|nr:glycoside hydrolase family 32 protein [Spirochaetales bacterium]
MSDSLNRDENPGTNPEFRGHFHFSPPRGWMNDPNGFSYFGGMYHLFYQNNPFGSLWGPVHWGHAVSPDLISWKNLPLALRPDKPYDAHGCWSGSAITHQDKHVLLYTGFSEKTLDEASSHARDGKILRQQVQCLAFGDGEHYEKYEFNPVIPAELLPPDSNKEDFRDPKLWKGKDNWYCLAGNMTTTGRGRMLLFKSSDLVSWKYVGVLLDGSGNLSGMVECPDYFNLEGKDVLMWSAIGTMPEAYAFQNHHSVVWTKGLLDPERAHFEPEGQTQELDKGPDFYAPQTLKTPDGRTILIAWMQAWQRTFPTHELGHGWTGQMTLPRELFWKDGQLAQRPVREIAAYRESPAEPIEYEGCIEGRLAIPGLIGQHLDIELELKTGYGALVGIELFKGDTEKTILTWDTTDQVITLDRSQSGIPIRSTIETHPNCQVYRAKLRTNEASTLQSTLRLRLILDRSSVEVYAQDGMTVLTSTLYPKAESDKIEFWVQKKPAMLHLRGWPLTK